MSDMTQEEMLGKLMGYLHQNGHKTTREFIKAFGFNPASLPGYIIVNRNDFVLYTEKYTSWYRAWRLGTERLWEAGLGVPYKRIGEGFN